MHETATFGAGCFWGVEAAFRKLAGVVDTSVGFSGGSTPRPTYQEVCAEATGHAEVVQIHFDPSRLAYEQLVRAFFALHDPTQVNRQGPDVGAQYRSVIFTHSDAQATTAARVRDELAGSGQFRRPIATQIVPAGEFFRAEEYHQRYLEKRGMGSCRTG